MDLLLLREALEARGEPAFRDRQIWEWAARGAGSYAEMTNLPLELRDALAGAVPFSSLGLAQEALARDGTEKVLLETADGRPVEAVLMRYRDGRRSLVPVEPVRLPAHLHASARPAGCASGAT